VRELAHEISHPLTAASLHLQQMNRELQRVYFKLDQDEKEHFKRRLAQALLSLEQASLLLNPELLPATETFQPADIIQGIVHVLQPVAAQAHCQIIFTSHCKQLLTGYSVYFRQIVNNLIYNAIEAYKTSTKAENRLILISVASTEDELAFKIQDFGAGIPRGELFSVFQAGFSSKGQGRGIGLALVKRLVEEAFGGNIQVTSQVGKGTTFVVSVPLWYNTREPKTAPFS
jgi:two-component system, NtrC family, nitrogen regulation sensor histidine kinase NtrY